MFRSLIVAVVGGCLATAAAAHAQQGGTYARNQLDTIYRRNSTANFTTNQLRTNLYNRTVPQYSYSQINRGLFSSALTGRPLGKPFSGATGGGSVSPWLALSEPFSSSAHNYYTQVRPQLEQQRINQQLATRNQQLQRQLNDIAVQPPYNPVGSDNMAPTGHVAAFMNYGGYYQPVQPTKNRR